MLDTQMLPDNVLTTQLKRVVNWARRSSLWPMPFATACCGIELMATASSRFDLARFGAEAMRFSPRQSDLLIVAGRVTIKMMPVLQHIYQQMTEPKWVISMGACASTGGVFDVYATIQGIDQFMPVDVYVPGCPPRPETLIEGIMAIQRIIDEDGLPPAGRRRPLHLAIEPSYVFAERDQWAEFTREHTGADAHLYLQINNGGYTIGDRYVAYDIGQASTLSVAAHEGWHQFLGRHFLARLPAFLEEGLATMYEGVQFKNGLPCYNLSINQNRAIMLRTAIDSHSLWSLEDLLAMNAGQVVGRPGNKINAWYAQAWALGRFLWDGDNAAYRPALQRILADTRDGTVYDPTGPHHNRLRPWTTAGVKGMLEHYLQMDFAQIDAHYQAYCQHIADDELPSMSELP
jgi:NADH-quinone oxidoreductase subunit B